jgi:hypothetical protein
MNFDEPIIIIGSPRSGTSLTAQIFSAHGVWSGTSRSPDEWNPMGYYENVMLTELRYRMGHGDGMDRDHVHDLIMADSYTGGPWMVKHSPPTWRMWRQFTPKWVLVRRNQDDIVRSRIRCGQWDMTEAEHRIAVETDAATLDAIHDYIGGVNVWPEYFFENQWKELDRAFDYAGLTLNTDEAKARLDLSLWNTAEK